MIALFIKFLPYVLILYFLYLSLEDPIFFMGIPFLMFIRTPIFFDKFMLFRIPFRSFDSIDRNPDIYLLVWVMIFWAIFKIRSKNSSEKANHINYSVWNTSILDYYILGLIIISFIGLGVVLNEYYLVENVYDEFFTLLSLFLGFFIIKDVVRHTEADVLEKFLFSLVIINSIASGLFFIHQGLHKGIYTSSQENEYLSLVIDGVVITRTFWFMPILWFFSISYLLVFIKKNTVLKIILLGINLLGIYISYTRSFLTISVLLFILYSLLTGFKNKNFGKAIKSMVIISIAGFALFMAVSSFMPASTKYFMSRFKELDEPSITKSNNLTYRFFRTGQIISHMDQEKKLFGYGSVTETQNAYVKIMHAVTADMAWTEVVFRWGFLGLTLFILLYVSSLIKAFFLFLKTEGIVSQLALLLLLTIVSQVVEGFTSYGIMSPNRFALGLWYFGILSALLVANKNQENKIK